MAEQPGMHETAAPPQHSPDGRWFWDGRQWLPAPLAAPRQRWSPGPWSAAVAAVLVVLGAALLIIAFRDVAAGFPSIDGATRVTAPGATEITLPRPGAYMISYEQDTGGGFGESVELNGETQLRLPAAMRLGLIPSDSATPVTLHAVSGPITYTSGSREGLMLATFSVDRPGTYALVSRYEDGQSQPQIVLAVAQGSPNDLFLQAFIAVASTFAGIGLVVVGFVAGGVMLVVRIRARVRGQPRRRPG